MYYCGLLVFCVFTVSVDSYLTSPKKDFKDITCPDSSACKTGTTCCPTQPDGSAYDCCPLKYAICCPLNSRCCFPDYPYCCSDGHCCAAKYSTCCSDGKTCCPDGTTCNGSTCMAIDGGNSLPIPGIAGVMSKSFQKGINSAEKATLCSKCQENTCCAFDGDSQYGCCPISNAICCDDKKHCCPYGYHCNSNRCTRKGDAHPFLELVSAE